MLTSELNGTQKPLIQAILSNCLHLRCRRTCASYRFSSDLLSTKSGHWWLDLFSWVPLYFDHWRFFDRSVFSWGNSLGGYIVLCYELHELVTEQFALQEHISLWFFQKPQLFDCVVRLSRLLDLLANSAAKEIIYVLYNLMQAHVKLAIIANNSFCAKIRRDWDVACKLVTNVFAIIFLLKYWFVRILNQRPLFIILSQLLAKGIYLFDNF